MHFEIKNLLIEFRQEWSQFFRPSEFNWLDFTFVSASVEWSRYVGSFEGAITLLGLRVRVTYSYNQNTE